jgi:hypothetical protein
MTIIEGTNASQNVRLDYSNTVINNILALMQTLINITTNNDIIFNGSYNNVAFGYTENTAPAGNFQILDLVF